MYYTIYKITNTVNNNVYIGKHQTLNLDDGYMGSGNLIRLAILKYGKSSFIKEIIHVFTTEDDMNVMEQEIVTEEFCGRADTYNICVGGKGGWSYVNKNGLNNLPGKTISNDHAQAFRNGFFKWIKLNPTQHSINSGIGKKDGFKGKKHTEETKKKMSIADRSGKKNSQFGTMWITNGAENKKIKKNDIIPLDWYKGRK